MKKRNLLFLVMVVLLAFSCKSDKKKTTESATKTTEAKPDTELLDKAKTLFKALPKNAADATHKITANKVALGKKLYYETLLSKKGTESCNTCHNLKTYGVDNQPTSKGDKGGLGERNSPTTLNAALHITQFWDGRAKDVEEQAGGPILNPVEMNLPNERTVEGRLRKDVNYPKLFKAAFPDDKNPLSFENLKKAIGAFERTLITPSKFDDFLKGNNDALNEAEKKGLNTFINAGCTACHSGALLGGNMYQKFPAMGKYEDFMKGKVDYGRYEVTKKEGDKFMFKVPSLRNIEKTFPYFHNGEVADLPTAVKIMGKAELNKDLSDQEVSEIVTFLKTLTGTVPATALQ